MFNYLWQSHDNRTTGRRYLIFAPDNLLDGIPWTWIKGYIEQVLVWPILSHLARIRRHPIPTKASRHVILSELELQLKMLQYRCAILFLHELPYLFFVMVVKHYSCTVILNRMNTMNLQYIFNKRCSFFSVEYNEIEIHTYTYVNCRYMIYILNVI